MKILYYVLFTISAILCVGMVCYVVIAYIKSGAFVSVFCRDMRRKDRHVPAADVAPVRHGRWMLIEYPYGQKTYICSECKDDDWWNGRYAYGDEHYCPKCGAKMDGDVNGGTDNR